MPDTQNTILIVDDDPASLKVLFEYLEETGFRVLVATHAEAALEVISHVLPNIILLDVKLPSIDGFDLAARLKANEDSRDIPIIFMSAFADVASRVKGFELGAVDYITKPIHVEEAAARINTHLTIHNLQKRLEEQNLRLQQEVTERKQMEEALKESEERLRGILSSLHETFIVVYDREGNYISAWGPPELEKRYGISGAETVGRPLKDILPPQEAKERIAHIQHILETGESWRGEQLVHLPGGDFWHDISLSPLEGPAGEVSAVVGFIRDITERKRAEEAIQESEERLKEVVENMPVLFDAFDENGIALFWNKECERVTGYSSDEIVGNPKSLELVCPDPEYRAWVLEQLRELGSYYRDWELDVQCKNGETRTIAWSNISRDHPIPGWWSWGIGVDVTERKRAEERLQRYAAELEQSNEEVKQFAYIVSHDLRAPLISLKGYAAELRSALELIGSAMNTALPHLDETQRPAVTTALQKNVPEALDFIDSSVTRMNRFISALLKLSRLGRRKLDFEPIDMNALVQAALQNLAHQIEERQVKVTVGPLPEVVADRLSMEQIMGNILDNALKYLDPDRPGEIEITAKETTFHVRDNGRGIAEKDMDKVFVPFRRASKEDVPGEGMGLAYVQTLVRRHGGRIWCESELGVGTTFTFTLPHHLTQGGNRV